VTAMEMDLDVKVSKLGNIPILDLAGDLDSYTCARLRDAILDLISKGEFRIVISLANVDYIDTVGLGTLVGGLRRVNEKNGGLALSGANPRILRVLSITGLNQVFSLFDDPGEAVRSLDSASHERRENGA